MSPGPTMSILLAAINTPTRRWYKKCHFFRPSCKKTKQFVKTDLDSHRNSDVPFITFWHWHKSPIKYGQSACIKMLQWMMIWPECRKIAKHDPLPSLSHAPHKSYSTPAVISVDAEWSLCTQCFFVTISFFMNKKNIRHSDFVCLFHVRMKILADTFLFFVIYLLRMVMKKSAIFVIIYIIQHRLWRLIISMMSMILCKFSIWLIYYLTSPWENARQNNRNALK